MEKLIFAAVLCSSLMGCIKLEIKPEGVVSETVDAGKALYQTLKRKRSGEEERVYTHMVFSKEAMQDSESFLKCRSQIEGNIALSATKLSKILSESSEVMEIEGDRKLKCTVVALVVPK